MSKIQASLNNILDFSISGLSELPEVAYEFLSDSDRDRLQINIIKSCCYEDIDINNQQLKKSICSLTAKTADILIKTSGHTLDFFDLMELTIKVTKAEKNTPNIWNGYTAIYEARLFARYNGTSYSKIRIRG